MGMDQLIVENHVTRRAGISAFVVLAAAVILVSLLLYWSALRTDSVSFERQQQLVSQALQQSVAKLIREQESVTLKDNWINFFRKPIVSASDIATLNGNQGPFLHRYFGHDEAYLVNDRNMPFYAMRDGRRILPQAFETARAAAEPLIEELRARTRALQARPVPNGSPGAYDFVVVNGHPAIVSVKPFLSPTGNVRQTPGREVVQISVVRLDGHFLQTLSDSYLLQGARFAWSEDRGGNEASLPFVSRRTGRVFGYFIWQPYAPGSIVRRDMIPPLLLTLLLIGSLVYILVRRIQRSTSQLQASEAQAKHLAFHDVLTGLPNRALFNDRLDRALAMGRRHPDRKLALLYLDLDRFKKVNDTLGHPAGDELIREMSRRLTTLVRETDTVARLGGDEFAIIQMDVKSQEDIEQLCARILAAVSKSFDLVGSQMFVGISIGVAQAMDDAHDRMELTRKADIALYSAKESGRGRYVIFEERMDATIQVRQSIERDLRVALDEGDQLQVHYQPVFEAGSHSICGAEALVRWNHPKNGMMVPATFIAIAEESGLIERLGEWVLEQACKAALLWPVETIAVNVSAVQLRNPLFAARVQQILNKTGLEPQRLELEITETSFMESVSECERNVKTLRAAGVRVALDDFGTGYSSFSYLHSLEVDRVKIDRSFVLGIQGSPSGSPIIQAIVDLAQAAGLKITAEGVETDEQSQYLHSVGCDELQGFLLCRPITLGDFDRLLGVTPNLRLRQAGHALAA